MTDEPERRRPLVVIANRLPVSRHGGEWRPSAGGLVTAMLPVMATRPGAWIGWDGGDDVPTRVDDLKADLMPVSLSRSEVNSYYHGFANRTIWPLFHDLVETPAFDRMWWRVYREVNERFAAAAAKSKSRSGRAPLLWVHDYHLMLVPQMLRKARPRAPIAFFLHIPWPPPELFTRLPWRAEILEGLLGADVLTFHTDRYRKNFVRTCGRVLDVTVRGKRIILPDGRTVHTESNPISIDAREFTETGKSPEVNAELARLQKQFEGRRILLGVDRLDYTKGILERIEAFELLLERRPDLRRRVTLVQIAVPSRGAVHAYRQLRSAIEEGVGRINGRFTEPGSDVPVYYLHRGVSRRRLIAYYRLADVMLVTPLKDGMNLVAKEYAVCRAVGSGAGALVLSEFTGASLELTSAIACNPFDVEGLSYRIEQALEMPHEERARRLKAMAAQVRRRDVHHWVERELDTVEAALAAGRGE